MYKVEVYQVSPGITPIFRELKKLSTTHKYKFTAHFRAYVINNRPITGRILTTIATVKKVKPA